MSRRGSLSGTEADFSKRVVGLARKAGWRVNHVYPSRVPGAWRTTTTAVGYPDLTLVKPGRLVILELKAPGGKPTAAQTEWIDLFSTLPGTVAAVVWPADWPWIVDTLTRNPTRSTR